MNHVTAKLIFLCALILTSSKPVFALERYATSSAVVSATILSTTFDPPILVSPNNNANTNNPREQLIWKRPINLPTTPLHHYDVYFDGQVLAASVSDSITSQNYYFYKIHRDGSTFYLSPTSDLSQGTHTWSVTAYDTSGTHVSSETRTFYLDSITPFITLKKVDRQTLNWSTTDYNTIPDVNLRDLSVFTSNPLLTGSVEPFANMQIILMCPQNILNCHNQTYQGNYPNGEWQHRFYGLIRGLVYTVYLSATDAGGNSVIFPEFYLAYGVRTPTPSAIITPKPTISPEATPTITIAPEPTPEIEIPPIPYIPVPPIAPTPPIKVTPVPPVISFTLSIWFLILLVAGLPLHLLMTIFGAQISLLHLFKFLFVLMFPFLGKKEYQTVPFATLEMYDPEKLESPWQTKIADINGNYHLISPLLSQIFVKISSVGRLWKNIIINNTILPLTCLIPLIEDTKAASNRLRHISLRFRSLPLIIACLTSGLAMTIQPNYFFLIYLYLSLQFAFSEYLYPKFSR